MLTGERTDSATGDAVLGEIEGDLRAGVAQADDEDAPARERRRVAVVAAVEDPAAAAAKRSSPSIFGAKRDGCSRRW